jgi:tRNA pseudouridine13 synthase
MKDKHAITRQVMSVHVPGKKLADFPSLQHERVQVLWADMHANKLRLGHLRGNRFSIRVREVPATAVVTANRVMRVLAERGVPNFFGEQRYGLRLNNHELGRYDLLGDWRGLLDELLGPDPDFPQMNAAARKCYASGDFENAYRAFPFLQQSERMAVRMLARKRSPKQAVFAINRVDRQFWVSAYQSAMFNRVVAERMGEEGGLHTLREGDLAYRHANGAVFRVTPEELAKPELAERAAKFEISPSGPLWGSRMTKAEGETGRREEAALADTGVAMDSLDRAARHFSCLSGSRRAMRIPLIDPEIEGGVDEHGSYVRCAFELPAGSFATVVMREIMKAGASGELPVANGEDSDAPDTEVE